MLNSDSDDEGDGDGDGDVDVAKPMLNFTKGRFYIGDTNIYPIKLL